MSLDKGIEHGKEHRKQYRGWEYYDQTCRNHGKDLYYKSNRTHKFDVGYEASEAQLEELNPRNRTSNGKKSHKRNFDKWLNEYHEKQSRAGDDVIHYTSLPKDKKVE